MSGSWYVGKPGYPEAGQAKEAATLMKPEGEWNSFDIFFEAPRFQEATVVKPAYVTLIFNGLLVDRRVELLGSTGTLPLAKYQPHAPEEALVLQGHTGPTRYRNVWIRRLKGYDTGTEYFRP